MKSAQLHVSDCFPNTGFRRTPTKLQKALVSQARNESRSCDVNALHSADPILTGTVFHVAQYSLSRDTDASVSPKQRANRRPGIYGRNTGPNRRCILRLTRNTSAPGPATAEIELRTPVRIDQFRSIIQPGVSIKGRKPGSLKSAACGTPPRRAYRP